MTARTSNTADRRVVVDCHTFTDRAEQVVSVVSGQKSVRTRGLGKHVLAPRAQTSVQLIT
jgi:hypothetical protein